MKENFKTNVRYGLLPGMYWLAHCSVLQFATMLYTSRGYDNFSIGLASMLGWCSFVVAQPLWGILCDQRPKIKKLILGGLIIAMAAATILPFSANSMLLTIFAIMVISFTFQPLAQVIDGWINRMNANGCNINYGVARSFGSDAPLCPWDMGRCWMLTACG